MESEPSNHIKDGSNFRRVLTEQVFWGLLGPLIPNVILMSVIFNIEPKGLMLFVAIFAYWLIMSYLISFVVVARANHNDVSGNSNLTFAITLIGTLLVVIFAHLRWTIFATFQLEPVSAFLFVLLGNFIGTLFALAAFHSKRIFGNSS